MELKKDQVQTPDLLTRDEFIQKKGMKPVTRATFDHYLDNDKLDFCWIGNVRMIVWNQKAEMFETKRSDAGTQRGGIGIITT